jgi:hypothetical protein
MEIVDLILNLASLPTAGLLPKPHNRAGIDPLFSLAYTSINIYQHPTNGRWLQRLELSQLQHSITVSAIILFSQ